MRRENISPPPKFEPRSAKPVESPYRLRYPGTHRFSFFIADKYIKPYSAWIARNDPSVLLNYIF
jgi:hypothetical protein